MKRRIFFNNITKVCATTAIMPYELLTPVTFVPETTTRPGGITREHIKEAAEYVFRGRPRPDKQINLKTIYRSDSALRSCYLRNGRGDVILSL